MNKGFTSTTEQNATHSAAGMDVTTNLEGDQAAAAAGDAAPRRHGRSRIAADDRLFYLLFWKEARMN